MASRLSRFIPCTLALAVGLATATGCNRDQGAADGPKREAPPNPPTPDPVTEPAAATPSDHGKLLTWMDPDAVSVAYLRLPGRLRSSATAVIYGLPPRAEDLLQAVTDLDHALDAVRHDGDPETETWLGTEALVTTGRLAQRPTVLHPLAAPREQVIARLEAIGLVRKEIDAFEVWEPERVFPYKVVLLDGDVAGFIPASEPGSGLPPLASARDMPPSDVETQLTTLLDAPDAPALALFAAGPMLHLDLDADVLAVRFEMRMGSDGGVDGQVALQLDGQLEESAKALEDHTAPEQSDRIQQMVQRTAYQVDGQVVAGRLQLTAADVALLYESRG